MKKIHLIGVGGSVMHNLAIALSRQGHAVTGSDNVIYDPARGKLADASILPAVDGWQEDNITQDLDLVILGMTAKEDNIERKKAQALGLDIISFPDYIAHHAADKIRVVIAGSHGKTTTTSMIMHVLGHQGLKFDYLVGSQLDGFELSVQLTTDAPLIIIEGDEYPASKIDRAPKIRKYNHTIGVLNGIARDHMNVFPTFEQYLDAFRKFIAMTADDGMLYWNKEDDHVVELMNGTEVPQQPYEALPYQVSDEGYYIMHDGARYDLQVFGHHFMINAAAAQAVCNQLGVTNTDFYKALATFSGARNRLTQVYEDKAKKLVVFRDFAHAPSKLKATIEAVRSRYPDYTINAFFELHTYSSLNPDFLDQYTGTLEQADNKRIFYTPESSQVKGLTSLSSESLQQTFGEGVTVIGTSKQLRTIVADLAQEKTINLFMSSGHFGGCHVEELF